MDNLEKRIEKIGLSEKETAVFIALLRAKEATVIKLAKMTNIKRTSIYHCLEELITKELAIRVTKDDKTYYFASDPKLSLNGLLVQQKEIIESVLPDLKNLFGKGAVIPEIKIYHNVAGLRSIFEDLLLAKEKIARYYVCDFNTDELLGVEFVDKLVKKRIDAGIKSLSLRSFKYKPEREKEITHSKQLREVKFLPEGVELAPYMCIYDNKAVIISAKEEKVGFIIESHEFAEAQKTIFDLIWNTVAI